MSKNIDPNIVQNLGNNAESLSHVDPLVLGDNTASSFDITDDIDTGTYILYSWSNQHRRQPPQQPLVFQISDANYCNNPSPCCIVNWHCRCALQWFQILLHHLNNHTDLSVNVYFIHWSNCHGVLMGPIDQIALDGIIYLEEMEDHYGVGNYATIVENSLPDTMEI